MEQLLHGVFRSGQAPSSEGRIERFRLFVVSASTMFCARSVKSIPADSYLEPPCQEMLGGSF